MISPLSSMSSMSLEEETLRGRLRSMSWGMVLLVFILSGVGFLSLYSAANGQMNPWASRQIAYFIAGSGLMFFLALLNIRWFYRMAYPFYAFCLVLLIIVDVAGHSGMGAQRWISFGFFNLQPSELAKIAVAMACARYFHDIGPDRSKKILSLIVPTIMMAVPVALIVIQPNLGTSLILVFMTAALFFVAGASIWLFVLLGAGAAALVPLTWEFLLHDYQKRRVMTFINPEEDPLGAGYNIIQSKIALGSGGLVGKGFMEGSQSHLNFLPEKHTDFIFTLWAEEWGFTGSLFVLVLYALLLLYGFWISLRCRHSFGRLLAFGLTINFSLYILINVGMVMGLLPVVGIPLPLMSYGGTAMIAVMIGFGILQSCHIYRDSRLPRSVDA